VAEPTRTQIDFAKVMTKKKRSVLNSLVMFDCYMSASEIEDEELRDIVRHQLARYTVKPRYRWPPVLGCN
jgi:hypothetical protein